MWFTHENNVVRGLVGGDNNIFVMKERKVFSNICEPLIYERCSVEDYAKQWTKREKEDLDTLSEWVKSVRV
jgi:hypothetical protein